MTPHEQALEIACAVTIQFRTWDILDRIVTGAWVDGVPIDRTLSRDTMRILLTAAVYKQAIETIGKKHE